MATKRSPSNPADIILAVVLEVGGLAIITAVAGISDGMANIMLIFVIGVALLWAMTHSSQLNGFLNMVNNAEKAAVQ